jgi:hypothetical protein
MSQADAGEVRIEASLGSADQLRDMPLKLQMDWREAQLGQLSRLASGSDAGWRGDVTADIDIHGTLDAAQTKARLRATGVHREEFAPDTPLDLDANCSFRYQHSQSAFHEVSCDTAIGDGRLHLKAEIPGQAPGTTTQPPQATLDVRQVPLQAVLDLLRTVRGGFAPGISAKGTVQGTLTYLEPVANPANAASPKPQRTTAAAKSKASSAAQVAPIALTGSLTLDGGVLKGGALKEPLTLPASIVWTPTAIPNPPATGLAAVRLGTQFTLTLPAQPAVSAAAAPQSLSIRFGASTQGYDTTASGSIAPARLRDLAYAFGFPHLDAADTLAGPAADLDLQARGPWLSSTLPAVTEPASLGKGDVLTANLKLHHAQWKAPYLAFPVELIQGTATLTTDAVSLTSEFAYGDPKAPANHTLKGTIDLASSLNCTGTDCQPRVTLHFGALDVATVQAALIGTPAQKSLLAPLLNRIRTEDRPKWPPLTLNVDADSLVLGPTTLRKPTLQMQLKQTEAAVDSWSAGLLEGAATGTGHLDWAAGPPKYTFNGSFTGVNPSELGSLLGAEWSGSPVTGSGDIALSGFTTQDLATSAAGHLKFNWPKGTMATVAPPSGSTTAMRFDQWSGTFDFHGGKGDLGDNALISGKHTSAAKGSITFGGPAKLTLGNTTIVTKQPAKAGPEDGEDTSAQPGKPEAKPTETPEGKPEPKPETHPETKPEE